MNKLYIRLTLAFLAVIVLTLCSITLALILILRNSPLQERQVETQLVAQAQGIATVFRRTARRQMGTTEGDLLLQETAERQEIRLAWANAEGKVTFDSGDSWLGQPVSDLFPKRATRTHSYWIAETTEGGQAWSVVGIHWPDVQNRTGDLIFAKPLPRLPFLQVFRNSLVRPLIQAGVLALIVGMILAVLISRSIASPLQKVARAARAFAGGEYGARAPEKGPDEVREVAQTFNEMARQVQNSQQAQRDLVANVAHDLRTPLTSIQGFAQALVDGTAASPETQAQAANAIYEETQRMRQMTDTLLDLARFEAGVAHIQRDSLDLTGLVEKRCEAFRRRAEENDVHFAIEAANGIRVTGDGARLEQVLDNLLENALRHTQKGGRITAGVFESQGQAEIFVADTGTGIPPEELPRIFERFYRGDKSRGGSSAGLGLAIVQEIARAHGGAIQAESVVGVGTKFTLRLPLEEPAARTSK